MQSARIVGHEELSQVGARLIEILVPLLVDLFAFDEAKETFGKGIIVGIARTRHTALSLCKPQASLKGMTTILASSITVHDQARCRRTSLVGLLKGIKDDLIIERLGQLPSDAHP